MRGYEVADVVDPSVIVSPLFLPMRGYEVGKTTWLMRISRLFLPMRGYELIILPI